MPILRTLLFVPGNRERMLEKARLIPADALILDLEDSVPPSEKEAARNRVSAAVGSLASGGKEIFVRINSLPTPYAGPDIAAVVTGGLSGICLPKSESRQDIKNAEALIAAAESEAGLTAGSVSILALVETAKGIVNVAEIVCSSPRIVGAIFGAEDFALDMEVHRTKEGSEVSYPRAALAVACRAAGVLAIDSVYTDFRDTDGLIRETRMISRLGFQGKALIHPDQVDPVNQVFMPAEEEVEKARRVLEAYESAVAQGRASVSLDGSMVDAPVAERARKLLTRAEAIAEKGKER